MWQVEVLSMIASAGGGRGEANSGDSRIFWSFTYYCYMLKETSILCVGWGLMDIPKDIG